MICVSEATDTDEQLANSAGRPIPGSQVRIGANGEIELRGANLTAGYLQHDQWADALTADGWFRSGDRGHLRPDGRIVVTGRTKDLIIRKGENVAPDEIENELLAHPWSTKSPCSASPTNCAASSCARSCVVRHAIATSPSTSSARSSTNAG